MPDLSEPQPSSAPARNSPPCTCHEDYMCGGHACGVLGDNDRPVDLAPHGVEWGDVARWEHDRDTALLARTLEDLAGMTLADAEALAAALRPLDDAGREPAELVSRADLRRLADRSQVAGPEMAHAWSAYRAAGMERLTAWQAFVAGIRAAAEWRRG